MKRCVLAILFVVLLLGSDSPREYDDRTTLDELAGVWQGVDGLRKEVGFYDGILTIRFSDGDVRRGSFRTGRAREPHHLEWILSGGLTLKCIYRIDGDTLRIACFECWDRRPQGFDDKGVIIFIYQRVKH